MYSDNDRIIDLTVKDLKVLFVQWQRSVAQDKNTHLSSERKRIGIKELCELFGFSKATVYNWVSQRLIPYSKVGRRLLFDLSDIEDWIKTKRVKTQSEIKLEINGK
ncbi:MAG: helix-turn-helix domain-containing protein [Bacteroidota bacterium]